MRLDDGANFIEPGFMQWGYKLYEDYAVSDSIGDVCPALRPPEPNEPARTPPPGLRTMQPRRSQQSDIEQPTNQSGMVMVDTSSMRPSMRQSSGIQPGGMGMSMGSSMQ